MAGCASSPEPPARPPADSLRAVWAAWTAARDSFYRAPDSPVLEADRAAFAGLAYFPYDSTFTFAAPLQPVLAHDTLWMQTSTGEMRPYVPYGLLPFFSRGRTFRLTAYKELGSDDAAHLFVPFADRTTGHTTYGGGRYLDLRERPGQRGLYVLDFNFAYHPYCVVNPAYSCPVPPPENRLDVAVTAGERFGTAAP